jgi:SOS-response transcriptional repressor LexA
MKKKMKETARLPILKYIQTHYDNFGYSPCIREIVGDLHTNHDYGYSTSHVWYHLKVLQEDGYISMDKYTHRSIRLIEKGRVF